MSVLKLKLSTSRPASYLTQNFETAGGKLTIAQRVSDFVERILSGNELGAPPSIAISIQDHQTRATGYFAFSAAPTANDTVIVNGVTFTCVASGATGNQFNAGTTASGAAFNLVSTINASTSALISGYLSASGTFDAKCYITSALYGIGGNQVTIAEGVDSGNVITESGSRLSGGIEDPTAQTLSF